LGWFQTLLPAHNGNSQERVLAKNNYSYEKRQKELAKKKKKEEKQQRKQQEKKKEPANQP